MYLLNRLRLFEKWGFGLLRSEVFDIVQTFILKNDLLDKVPFKNGVPGEDWFLGFKKRHRLSVKKPQAVEYARKKVVDPFLIHEYFDNLEDSIRELGLENKPHRIWNLDETSFCTDPSRFKVVGAIDQATTRTIADSGKENTSVLFACNAAGGKAPPLIIYKGTSMWNNWYADACKEYPGMVYATAKKGWMITDIFENVMINILLPLIATEDSEPGIIIFDGHVSHISFKVAHFAAERNIRILKLPSHSSDHLQPLDLSSFKSMKNNWDKKMIEWGRRHIGLIMPKREFSNHVSQIWRELTHEVIQSGFRRGGIVPFNRYVIPESKFHPAALKRWKKEQADKIAAKNSETEQLNMPVDVEEQDQEITTGNLPNESLNLSIDIPEVLASSTPLSNISSSSVNSSGTSTSTSSADNTSFEELLLQKITQKPVNPNGEEKQRRKVVSGSEILTSTQGLAILSSREEEKEKKEEEKQRREDERRKKLEEKEKLKEAKKKLQEEKKKIVAEKKKEKEEKKISSATAKKGKRMPPAPVDVSLSTKRKRGRPKKDESSSDSDSDDQDIRYDSSGDDPETVSDLEEADDVSQKNRTFAVGDFCVVAVVTEHDKTVKHYVGEVKSIKLDSNNSIYELNCLRKQKDNRFLFRPVPDLCWFAESAIKEKVERIKVGTTSRQSEHYIFDADIISTYRNMY